MTTGGPRYATLQDYLRVIRRGRWIVIGSVVGFTVLALLYSATQSKTYESEASLSYRDLLTDLRFLGLGAPTPEEQPQVRAAINAEIATSPEVTRRVKEDLKTDLSVDELEGAVSTSVGLDTNLVEIEARSGDAEFAAELANSYAEQAREVGTEDQLERVIRAEDAVARSLKDVGGSDDPLAVRQRGVLEQELITIQALRRIAEPVEIVERATVPETPASPQVARNTLIGAALGLVFGLIAVFVRDALDRRVHGVREIHEDLGMPVLGRVSERALGHPGLARNGPVAMSEPDFESFRVLRTNLGYLNPHQPPRVILVTSVVPEEGKSTVSMSLASACALAGQRTLLVECDLRRPDFAERLGIAAQPGLTDYLASRVSPQDVLQTVELRQPRAPGSGESSQDGPVGSFVCITAGSTADRPAELLLTERFRNFLAKVSKAYDLVILDTSPLLSVVDSLEIVPQVDGVLVCARARQLTRDQARAARATLDHLPERPMGAVLTGVRSGDGEANEYYYGY